MNSPKISVIVPVYNVEKYLRRCIDSILCQTFTDFEVLLIDDGSEDKSGEICDEYAGKDYRVRTLHKARGGVSSARNMGLDNAKGDWITFSDSDDELMPNAFLSACSYMQVGVDMIRTGYQVVNEQDLVRESHFCDKTMIIDNKEQMLELCERYQYFGFLWNSFIKKSIIGSVRFETNISWCEDHIFVYTLMSNVDRLVLLPICTYHYMVDSSRTINLSSRHISPLMVLRAAKMEREAKYRLIGSNEDLRRLVDVSYESKLNKAAVDSFYLDGFLKTILFILKESSNPLNCFKQSYKTYLQRFAFFRLLRKAQHSKYS